MMMETKYLDNLIEYSSVIEFKRLRAQTELKKIKQNYAALAQAAREVVERRPHNMSSLDVAITQLAALLDEQNPVTKP